VKHLLESLLRLLGIRRKKDFRGHLLFETFYPKREQPLGDYYVIISQFWSHNMATLDVKLGDTGTHTAVYAVTNLDGTPAEGVTIGYASDNPTVCAVDPTSGALTLVAVGTANITGTGTRGAFTHSDSGTVTIAQSDDFTGVLTLT
jgi:uncharacterized protein YjdB